MNRRKQILRPVAFGLSGALLVWAVSLLIPDRYTSHEVIRLNVEPYPAADAINQAYQEAVSRKALKGIIEGLNLYPSEREKFPLEDVIEQAKREVKIEVLKDHGVGVAFAYQDSAGAEAATNAVMANMVRVSEDYYRKNPGWGRLERTKAAGPGEPGSHGSTLAFWRPRRYVSQGTMAITNRSSVVVDRNAMERRSEDLRQSALSAERLSRLIGQRRLYGSKGDGDTDEGINEMRRDLRMERSDNVLIIKFTYPDSALAKSTLDLLTNELADERNGGCVQPPPETGGVTGTSGILGTDELGPLAGGITPSLLSGSAERHICRDMPPPDRESTITLLEPASLPEESDGPSRPILSIFGCFLGLGLWTALKD